MAAPLAASACSNDAAVRTASGASGGMICGREFAVTWRSSRFPDPLLGAEQLVRPRGVRVAVLDVDIQQLAIIQLAQCLPSE